MNKRVLVWIFGSQLDPSAAPRPQKQWYYGVRVLVKYWFKDLRVDLVQQTGVPLPEESTVGVVRVRGEEHLHVGPVGLVAVLRVDECHHLAFGQRQQRAIVVDCEVEESLKVEHAGQYEAWTGWKSVLGRSDRVGCAAQGHVVLQVPAHASQVLQDSDAQVLQVCRRTHARQHQQLRRLDSPGGHDHLLRGPHSAQNTVLPTTETILLSLESYLSWILKKNVSNRRMKETEYVKNAICPHYC